MNSSKIIDALGGTSKVAELCEVSDAAVSQWRTSKEGIPNARLMFLKLARPDVFKALEKESTQTPEAIAEAEAKRNGGLRTHGDAKDRNNVSK